jgi:mRNA interferase RelE/StbE
LYKIVLSREAEKEYVYLHRHANSVFIRIRNAIHSIAEDPRQGKPLRLALRGKWSYRVGAYRIIYSVDGKMLIVYILDIGHRREVYK